MESLAPTGEDLLADPAYLRLILDSAADAFYCVDRDGVTTLCNRAFVRMLGFEGEADAIGRRLHDVIHHSHPDGSPYDKADCPIYQGAQSGEARHVDDEVFYRLDGGRFPVEYWVRPIVRDGALEGAICNFIDITARKAAEEVQTLLLREMNHRVKNLFAVVNGVVSLSSRAAGSPRAMAEAIRGRLDAIARAHELILPISADADGRVRRTDLMTLAKAVLGAYGVASEDGAGGRVRIEGPVVAVGETAASALALVAHELATNAIKYGALSNDAGSIDLDWTAADGALRLNWRERDGPPMAGAPAAEGFGSLLARRGVVGQLGGRLERDWRRDGLAVLVTAPLERISAR